MRTSFSLAAIAVATLAVGGISTTAQAGNDNHIVARGDCRFQANHNVECDYQWQHGDVTVRRGSTLTVTDTVTPADLGGHTFTIVRASDVPKTIEDVFNCAPDPSSSNQGCAAAGGHFATDPPTDVLNVGPAGLDQPGDSLLVPPGGSISAKVTAARGTTLHFICTFHPWMQGTIHVA